MPTKGEAVSAALCVVERERDEARAALAVAEWREEELLAELRRCVLVANEKISRWADAVERGAPVPDTSMRLVWSPFLTARRAAEQREIAARGRRLPATLDAQTPLDAKALARLIKEAAVQLEVEIREGRACG